MQKNNNLYTIGYLLRALGLAGTGISLLFTLSTFGPFFIFGFYYIAWLALPALLLLAIGHYLASNNKPEGK